MIHHIPVSPLHTGGRVLRRNHGLKVAGFHQCGVPFPLCRRPGISLRRTGNRGLHRHIRMGFPQCQNALTEIQVAALCHSADKMAVSLFVSQFHRIPHPLFQRNTPRIRLIVPPRQFGRPVPCKTTALLSCPHAAASLQIPLIYNIEHLFPVVNRRMQTASKIYYCKFTSTIVY